MNDIDVLTILAIKLIDADGAPYLNVMTTEMKTGKTVITRINLPSDKKQRILVNSSTTPMIEARHATGDTITLIIGEKCFTEKCVLGVQSYIFFSEKTGEYQYYTGENGLLWYLMYLAGLYPTKFWDLIRLKKDMLVSDISYSAITTEITNYTIFGAYNGSIRRIYIDNCLELTVTDLKHITAFAEILMAGASTTVLKGESS